MDRDALKKQMKTLKAKAKAARKGGKRELAHAFQHGSARLLRQLKATAPHKSVKAQAEAAAAAPATPPSA